MKNGWKPITALGPTMHHLSTTTNTLLALYASLSRLFTTLPKPQKLPVLSNIPYKYRPKAIFTAQKALTDYLHTTRSIPYTFAEHIAKNSPSSLSLLLARLPFSAPAFPRTFTKFLYYHPISEFEFFFESIGFNPSEIHRVLPPKKHFFADDPRALNAACALSNFGFPWTMLGQLYKADASIFGMSSNDLTARLSGFKSYGFNNVSVIGICLVFPYVLSGESEMGDEINALFDDLRKIFVDHGLVNCLEENVDTWYDTCRKIRTLYELGCEKGKMGELIGRAMHIFEYKEEVLVKSVDFFCRLGVRKNEVGLLIIKKPDVLNFELENGAISVLGFLKHFGLSTENLKSVAQKYPYVMGRNKMSNLPHVMRALDLHEWFFDEMRNGNHNRLAEYSISNSDEDVDANFADGLEKINSSRTPIHTTSKVNFLLGNGFGENSLTIKVLAHLHGSSCQLQERFDCLLRAGIEFSKLCKMTSSSPKILNQSPETLVRKINFLCQDMGLSLQYLDVFPALLCFDLENRIRPRYRMHTWLRENNLYRKNYSIASLVATSEKKFVAHLFSIHPAAPKLWLECFL